LNLDYSTRVKIGVTLIALYALVSTLAMLNKDAGRYHKSSIDEVSLYENRFAGFKNILQPYTIVGYITDQQSDKVIEEYYLTQYVLSPIIIVRGTAFPFVIGNFHKPVNISRISQDNHLTLIKELGDGVMLFKSKKVK
jgi:hypothetical protein